MQQNAGTLKGTHEGLRLFQQGSNPPGIRLLLDLKQIEVFGSKGEKSNL